MQDSPSVLSTPPLFFLRQPPPLICLVGELVQRSKPFDEDEGDVTGGFRSDDGEPPP